MPRQFTPADRETVKERFKSFSHVTSVVSCGEGLRVRFDGGRFESVTGPMEDAGWFVAGIHWEDSCIIFMPVSDVPE